MENHEKNIENQWKTVKKSTEKHGKHAISIYFLAILEPFEAVAFFSKALTSSISPRSPSSLPHEL